MVMGLGEALGVFVVGLGVGIEVGESVAVDGLAGQVGELVDGFVADVVGVVVGFVGTVAGGVAGVAAGTVDAAVAGEAVDVGEIFPVDDVDACLGDRNASDADTTADEVVCGVA